MTLKSALEDLQQTTLAAITGLLGKLSYLASLRSARGRYEHWGMDSVHGEESSQKAIRAAHTEVVTAVLRTPLAELDQDASDVSRKDGVDEVAYVEGLREHFDDLLPGERQDSPAARHLNSVLVALWSLKRNRERATRSTS
jgi:hypothetical protein